MTVGRLKCDACGQPAPDVVAPILHGIHGWREFAIDGVDEERGPWEASVLLCDGGAGWRRTGKGCRSRMEAFVDSGGLAGHGPKPPNIVTSNGGRDTEPRYLNPPAGKT